MTHEERTRQIAREACSIDEDLEVWLREKIAEAVSIAHEEGRREAAAEARGWAYMLADDGAADGPFVTREEALADAVKEHGHGAKVKIGRITQINPLDWARRALDASEAIERMDTLLGETICVYGDEWFQINGADEKAANAALGQALATWAAEYVYAEKAWYLDGADCEEVAL